MKRFDHTTDGGPALLISVFLVLLASVAMIAVVSQSSSMWVAAAGLGVIVGGLAALLALINEQLRNEGEPVSHAEDRVATLRDRKAG
jgi:hypothetical protein